MRPTVGEVLCWRPSALLVPGRTACTDADLIGAGVQRMTRAAHELAASWAGQAADTAQGILTREAETGRELGSLFEQAGRLLDEAAERLGAARDRLASLVERATADGFAVADDGGVTPTAAVPGSEAPAVTRAVAAQWQGWIVEALEQARDADQEVAGLLRAVEAPSPLAAEVEGRSGVPLDASRGVPLLAFPSGYNPWREMRAAGHDEWVALARGAACLPVLGGAVPTGRRPVTGYYGGGVITGPDGRDYPLVTPVNAARKGTGESYFSADTYPRADRAADLAGRDSGWSTVGFTAGVADFGEPMGWGTKLLVGAGLLTGMRGPVGLRRRNDLLRRLTVSPSGHPSLVGASSSPVTRRVPVGDPRSNPVDEPPWEQPERPRHIARREAGLGAAAHLIVGGANAATFLATADSDLAHAYTLTLEQNVDGRRRAMLNVYDIFDESDGSGVRIHARHAHLEADGELALTQIRFRAPDHGLLSSPYQEVSVR